MKPVFSSAYLPPIDYMAALLRHPEVLIEVHETYPKQTFRNRMLIMTSSGVRPLVVPVSRPQGNHTPTVNVEIVYRERWNIIHLRTLRAAYSASPYFLYYFDELEALLMSGCQSLVELNKALVLWLLRCMKASVVIEFTSAYLPEGTYLEDYRARFSPKSKGESVPMPTYYQVFADRIPFVPNLSVLDLLMNLGPESLGYLRGLALPQ